MITRITYNYMEPITFISLILYKIRQAKFSFNINYISIIFEDVNKRGEFSVLNDNDLELIGNIYYFHYH